MSRAEELAITICIIDVGGAKDNWTETEFGELNARISETLGIELRNYTRSVDDALFLNSRGMGR